MNYIISVWKKKAYVDRIDAKNDGIDKSILFCSEITFGGIIIQYSMGSKFLGKYSLINHKRYGFDPSIINNMVLTHES